MATEPPAATNGVHPAPLSPLDVLTLTEAAAYLRLPEDAVRAEADAGRLVGRCVCGEWRFARDSVAAWLRTPQPKPFQPPRWTAESEAEYEAFMASIRAQRDEVNRATKSGPYAEE